MINCYSFHRCGKAVAEELDEGLWLVDFNIKDSSNSLDKSVVWRRLKRGADSNPLP